MNSVREHAILVITEGVMVMLFKARKNIVITPVKIDDIEALILSSNVSSAASIAFKEDVEGKVGRSHLIIESPSMALLMRFLLEMDYPIEIEFADDVNMREGGKAVDFYF